MIQNNDMTEACNQLSNEKKTRRRTECVYVARIVNAIGACLFHEEGEKKEETTRPGILVCIQILVLILTLTLSLILI